MEIDVNKTSKPSFDPSRLFFMRLIVNVVWLIAILVIFFLYGQTASRIEFFNFFYTTPWYRGFIIKLAPFLIIQGIFHWLILKHFFPQQRDGNIVWVIMMPLLFLFCYGIFTLIIFFLAIPRIAYL